MCLCMQGKRENRNGKNKVVDIFHEELRMSANLEGLPMAVLQPNS